MLCPLDSCNKLMFHRSSCQSPTKDTKPSQLSCRLYKSRQRFTTPSPTTQHTRTSGRVHLTVLLTETLHYFSRKREQFWLSCFIVLLVFNCISIKFATLTKLNTGKVQNNHTYLLGSLYLWLRFTCKCDCLIPIYTLI